MHRKPSFPVANCSIKMPDACNQESVHSEEEWEPPQRRQQLINFGHSQWGFNNWSWSVSKQDLDFVDFVGGKCTAGVAAFVSVSVKSFEIHRENVGYATAIAPNKGSAIHRARKCAVTNALRETLLSFGGSVATELMELLDSNKTETIVPPPQPEPLSENNQNIPNKQENKNSPLSKTIRKDSLDSGTAGAGRSAAPAVVKGALSPVTPVARAHPMPAAGRMPRPPAPHPPQPAQPPHQHPHPPPHPVRPNSNDAVGIDAGEEEARAERKRRQRLAQEEFRLKQMMKQNPRLDDNSRFKDSSLDSLLVGIPSQDIVIEETGACEEMGKRKSPTSDGGATKRRGSVANKLSIYID